MVEQRAGSGFGRAYAALACWYALACCLPAAVATLIGDPAGSGTPGYSYVNERLEECTGKFGCPTGPVDVGALLQTTALVLAPSLVVAVPLCAYFVHRWREPALAGFVAAVTGWAALCVGGLLFRAG